MAEKKQYGASKFDALYSWLSYDLQRMKSELLTELKYSSTQASSLYQTMKEEQGKSTQTMAQEIRYSYKQNQTIYDGVAQMITENVGARLESMDEKMAALQQTQGELVASDIMPKLASVEEKVAMLEAIEAALADIQAKLAALEDVELTHVTDTVCEKTEESVSQHSREVLEAVAAIENVDYTRIVDEVGDKMIEVLGEIKPEAEPVVVAAPVEVDYDRIVYGTTEKVIESLPVVEKVDYGRITENFAKAAENVKVSMNEEVLWAVVNSAVEKAVSGLASSIAEKVVIPEIDYDALAEKVAQRLTATNEVVLDEEGIAQIADKVADKLGKEEPIDYGKVSQAVQEAQIVPESVDYDRIAEIVEDKLSTDTEEEITYDLVIDEDGIQAIAKGVAEELCNNCTEVVVEEVPVEAPVEEVVEAVEEVVEEAPVEEVVEEVEEVAEEAPVEETTETVEEVVEEVPVEETVEETIETVEEIVEEASAAELEAKEELAVAAAVPSFEELNDQLVDAETGLVIRLKKSFTAKMRQSADNVKEYYSSLKNELTSYKKVNSNISWHGDRFNYGRDTVAKINICGKTLCFYLALDPNDPEYKQTVYHQKDVGAQKAYESTPFMVKIKSEGAVKKALRLVGILADKLGTQKEADFEAVDYVEQFGYQSTKELYETGFIKATKEKKVDLDF